MTTFTILGQPATKGSTVSFLGERGVVTKASCKTLASWTQAVGWAARAARVPLAPKGMAVEVTAWFQFVPPQRPVNRDAPVVKPDIDKLGRALLDALTGVAYVDDAQVVSLSLGKGYGPDARTNVYVEQLEKR